MNNEIRSVLIATLCLRSPARGRPAAGLQQGRDQGHESRGQRLHAGGRRRQHRRLGRRGRHRDRRRPVRAARRQDPRRAQAASPTSRCASSSTRTITSITRAATPASRKRRPSSRTTTCASASRAASVLGNGGSLQMDSQPSPKEALPVITFEHDVTLHSTAKTSAPCTCRAATPTATASCSSRNRTSCTWATTSSPTAFRSSTSMAAAA